MVIVRAENDTVDGANTVGFISSSAIETEIISEIWPTLRTKLCLLWMENLHHQMIAGLIS